MTQLTIAAVLALTTLVAEVPPAPPAASPRGALSEYLALCREGRDAEAAQLLELPPAAEARGPELARRLKAVLDRYVWFDLGKISDDPAGDRSDGLPPELEDVGRVPRAGGSSDPVLLVRRVRDGEPRWAFAAGTVASIDGWYAQLGTRWLLEHLPPSLLRPGPRELLWWQIFALPLVAIVAWLLALAAARASITLLKRFAARTSAHWDDELVRRLPGPVRVGWWLALLAAGVRLLDLTAPAERFVDSVLETGGAAALFWALLRSADIFGQLAAASPWASSHPASRSLLPIAVRASKVGVVALAVVQILALWGVPVASLLAGLGIGGLALALAAQKTVENLFGSFSIGVDQPFREGDFVRVEDVVGTVEAIGLRSTRIRTLDRTIVTIPNGKLADTRVESFAARDRIRLACTLGLVYGTTAEQMRQVLAGLERVLKGHPRIWPESVVVRFKELGASSLDVEVMAWFQTPDWSEFQAIRQDVLIAFMSVVESAGTGFAFPTRTVHVRMEGAEAPGADLATASRPRRSTAAGDPPGRGDAGGREPAEAGA